MRVDALENEVARLRKQAEQRPSPKPPRRARWGAGLVVAGGALTAILVGLVFRSTTQVSAAPVPLVEPATPPPVMEKPSLGRCIADIAPVTQVLDEVAADPHRGGTVASWVPNTAASCRTEIMAVAASGKVDDSVRDQLVRWAAAEDELGSRISMITVYYGSDPYRLDHYTTAPQLWREYNRARLGRDAVLADLRKVLAGNPAALDVEIERPSRAW